MRQPERQRDERLLRRREPFVAEITDRPEWEAARAELVVELRHPRLELAAFDAHAEIADAHGQ
jgi:hypothetical protein